MAIYLLLEDGGKITLEDASGFLLLEAQGGAASTVVAGVPSRKRYEVQRRNGEVITVSTEADLELLLRQIKSEAPKKKRSRKIKRAFEAEPLQDVAFNAMGAVLAIMAEQSSRRMSEAALLSIVADMLLQQAQDEEEAILLLLS